MSTWGEPRGKVRGALQSVGLIYKGPRIIVRHFKGLLKYLTLPHSSGLINQHTSTIAP